MRILTLVITGLIFSSWIQAQPGGTVPGQDRVPGRLIVEHVGDPGDIAAARAFARHGARVRRQIGKLHISVINVSEASLGATMQSLRANPLFRRVDYDYYARPAAVPNDPSYGSQWYLQKIQAAATWDSTTGSSSPIAVVDSGVDGSHPDLAGRLLAGWNFVANNGDTSDTLGHGTAVVGTLAAIANNGAGIAGVTWKNPVLPLVACDSSGYASYSNIAAAIQYAADHGARVINVSLGGYTSSWVLQDAVDYAWNSGAIVVGAAMNDTSPSPAYPAACNHAIAVSATESNDTLSGFSNYGSWITLSAPGNNILTTTFDGGYGWWYGTSFSAPIVSGVAALALAANPSLSAQALVTMLEQNADDLGAAGFDNSFGWGRVNAYRTVAAALAAAGSAPAPAPAPTSTSTASSGMPILINAGGPALTDASGHAWTADNDFANGAPWTVGNWIGNTATQALYQTCRYGEFNYTLPVANGNYTVVLKFAEVSQGAPGQRVFNVALNGTPVLTNFDIYAQTGGPNIALDESFPVSVTNGQIVIQFTNGWANSPMVNAIEVVPAGSSTF